jgi:hypothetical protein
LPAILKILQKGGGAKVAQKNEAGVTTQKQTLRRFKSAFETWSPTFNQ